MEAEVPGYEQLQQLIRAVQAGHVRGEMPCQVVSREGRLVVKWAGGSLDSLYVGDGPDTEVSRMRGPHRLRNMAALVSTAVSNALLVDAASWDSRTSEPLRGQPRIVARPADNPAFLYVTQPVDHAFERFHRRNLELAGLPVPLRGAARLRTGSRCRYLDTELNYERYQAVPEDPELLTALATRECEVERLGNIEVTNPVDLFMGASEELAVNMSPYPVYGAKVAPRPLEIPLQRPIYQLPYIGPSTPILLAPVEAVAAEGYTRQAISICTHGKAALFSKIGQLMDPDLRELLMRVFSDLTAIHASRLVTEVRVRQRSALHPSYAALVYEELLRSDTVGIKHLFDGISGRKLDLKVSA